MKKILHIFLAIVFLYNAAGYFAVFQLMSNKIQKKALKAAAYNLNKKTLTPITVLNVSLSEIQWTRKGKEFRYKGGMYDVMETQTNAKTTTFFCIKDSEEDALFAQLKEHIKRNSNNSPTENSQHSKILKNAVKDYFIMKRISLILYGTKNSNFAIIKNRLLTEYITHNTPPPKVV